MDTKKEVSNTTEVRTEPKKRISFIGDVSTKAIVASVLMGVLMAALQQIGERVDTILFAGAFPLFGIIIANTIGLIAVLAFGWVGGLLAEEINPMVGVATATGPLAPLWFITNFAQVTGMAAVKYMIGKPWQELSLKETFLICFGGTVLNSLVMLPVQMLYFNMPVQMIAIMVTATFLVGVFIPPIIARRVLKSLSKSRLLA